MNEYVVLFDGGGSVHVFADSCQWDSDSIEFLDGDENTVAMFKMEHLIGYFRKITEVKEENNERIF